MKIFGLDSSGQVASAAVVENDRLTAEYTICSGMTHSQTLLPMMDDIKQRLRLDLQTVDAIAVAAGPGSFTGLRIGAATAKGLGLALGKPLVAVPTLDAMAYALWCAGGLVAPMIDARRQQVFAGIYRFVNGKMEVVLPAAALPVEALCAHIDACAAAQTVVLAGDGASAYRALIEPQLKTPHLYAPAHANLQRAGAVAALGAQYAAEGRTVSADAFAPLYLRQTQAEREQADKTAALRAAEAASGRLQPVHYGAGESYE